MIPIPAEFPELYKKWEAGHMSVYEFARLCNMGKSTMYTKIKEYRECIDKNKPEY